MVARKKRARPDFSGALAEPIIEPCLLQVALVAHRERDCPAAEAAVYEAARDWALMRKCGKLIALLQHYGIDLDDPNRWLHLALRLAEDFVEGFQVIEHPRRGRGRPHGSGRNRIDRFELFAAVRTQVATQNQTVAAACRALARARSGPWKGHTAETLESRYHEFQKELKAHRRSAETDPLLADLKRAAQRARKAAKPE
jgi:hypothetical protein